MWSDLQFWHQGHSNYSDCVDAELRRDYSVTDLILLCGYKFESLVLGHKISTQKNHPLNALRE